MKTLILLSSLREESDTAILMSVKLLSVVKLLTNFHVRTILTSSDIIENLLSQNLALSWLCSSVHSAYCIVCCTYHLLLLWSVHRST